jgi:tape measure domain-containing protein
MSTNVTNEVVELQFKNQQFEQGVKESLDSVEKLKKGLQFEGTSSGLEKVTRAAKSVASDGLMGIQESVTAVENKFSAMQVVATTALVNITNSALNAGKNLLSSLTIEPISQGYSEYELKMNSVQTIMASTGESLDTVNGYLDELNTYADQTIYSFSDMTSNIGKFTNAGVSLDKAVGAIKGISNAAAVSGANTSQASHAMYNFAQALSAGYVKLIDWKSIETATMSTVEFKQQLIDAAVAQGTLTKSGEKYVTAAGTEITATQNFNESLTDAWMTSDVLISTLNDYADSSTEIGAKATEAATKVKTFSQLIDTLKESVGSGWAQTFEILIGDFEEAKKLFTSISDEVGGMITDSSNQRNNFLEGVLGDASEVDCEKFRDAYDKVIQDIDGKIDKLDWQKAFVKNGYNHTEFRQTLLDMAVATGDLKKENDKYVTSTGRAITANEGFVASLKDGWLTANMAAQALQQDGADEVESRGRGRTSGRTLIIETLTNAYSNLKTVVTAVHDAFLTVFPRTSTESIYQFIKGVHDLSEKFKISEKTGEKLKKVFIGIFSAIDIIITPLKVVVGLIGGVAKAIGTAIISTKGFGKNHPILDFLSGIGEKIQNFDKFIQQYLSVGTVCDKVSGAFSKAGEFIGDTKEALLGYSDSADKSKKSTKTLTDRVTELCEKYEFMTPIVTVFGAIGMALKKVAGAIKTFFVWVYKLPVVQNIVDKLRDTFSRLKYAFPGTKDLDGTESFFEKVKTIFSDLGNIIKSAFSKIDLSSTNPADIFQGIADVIKSIKDKLLDIASNFEPIKKLFGVFDGVKDFFASAFTNKSPINASGVEEVTTTISTFSRNLSTISDSSGTVNTVLGTLGAIGDKLLENLDKISQFVLAIAGGKALWSFGKVLDGVSEIEKGIASIPAGVGKVLSGAANILSSTGKLIKSISFSVKIKVIKDIAIAIAILVGCVFVLTQIDQEKIPNALLTIGLLSAMLLAMVAITNRMSNIKDSGLKDTLKSNAIFISFGITIGLLAKAMKKIDDLKNPIRSLEILSVVIGETIACIMLMSTVNKQKKTLEGCAATFIAFGASMLIISYAIAKMGSMDPAQMAQGIAGMSIAMGELIVLVAVVGKCNKGLKGSSKYGSDKGTAYLLVSFAASLVLIGLAMKEIGSMEPMEMLLALQAITILMGELLVVIAVTNKVGSKAKKVDTMLISLGVCLVAIAAAIRIVGTMDGNDVVKGTAAISALMVVMALIIKVSESAGEFSDRAGSMLNKMTSFLIAIAVAILILGTLSLEAVIQGTAVVAGIMTLMAVLIYVTKSAGKANFKMIAALTAAVLSIAVAVGVLAQLDPESLTVASACLSGLMVALGFLIKMSSTAKKIKLSSLAAIALIVGMVGGIIVALAYITSDDGTKAKNIAEGLAPVLAACAVMMVALDKVGSVSPAVIQAAATIGVAFDAIIGIITGLLVLLGYLDELVGDKITEGIDLLVEILTGVGEAIGGLVGGFFEGLTSTLPQIGENLAKFGENCLPFFEAIEKVDDSTADRAKTLVDIFSTLVNANIFSVLQTGFTGGESISSFTDGISALGDGLHTFLDSISDITDDDVTRMSKSAETISSLADSLKDIQTVQRTITYDKEGEKHNKQMESFIEDLGTLGDGMSTLKDKTSSITDENANIILKIADCIKALAQAANEIPGENGLLQKVEGTKNLGTFCGYLESLATNIMTLGNAAAPGDGSTGFTDEMVVAIRDRMCPTLQAIIDVAKNIPNEGGLLSKIVGDNTLGQFVSYLSTMSSEMMTLGNAAVGDGENSNGFTDDMVTAIKDRMCPVLQAIIDVAKEIPNEGLSVVSVFLGDNKLGDFCSELASMSTGMMDLAEQAVNFGDDDATNINRMIPILTAIVEMATSIPNSGMSVARIFIGDNDLKTFMDKVPSIADTIIELCNKFKDSGLKKETVSNYIGLVSEMIEALNSADIGGASGGLLQAIIGTEGSLESIGTAIGNLGTGLNNFWTNVRDFEEEDLTTMTEKIIPIIRSLNGIKYDNLCNIDFNIVSCLDNLGQGMADLYDGVTDCTDDDTIDRAFTMAGRLVELCRTMSGDDIDTSKLSTSSGAIKSLTSMIKETMKDMDDISSGDFSDLIDIISDDMVTMLNNISGATVSQDNINTLTTFTDAMVGFCNGEFDPSILTQLSTAIGNLVSNVRSISDNNINQENVDNYIATIKKIVKNWITDMETVLTSSETKETVSTASDTLFGYIEDTLNDKQESIQSIGYNLIKFLAAGITNAQSKVETAMKNILTNSAVNVQQNPFVTQSLYNTGKSITEGMAKGITNQDAVNLVNQNASTVAQNASDTMKKTLNVNSPSKVTMKHGRSFTEGFAIGIGQYVKMSNTAAEDAALEAMDTLKTTFASVAELADTNDNYSPTITPVLDISKVKSGVRYINDALNNSSLYAVNADLSGLAAGSDLVEDIRELIDINRSMLSAIQSGGDVYLNEKLIVGRINRRLGML